MSNGVERRSQIDTETVKALLLINGGGVAALLTVFSQVIGKPGYEPLASEILVGVLIFMFGLVCAVIHNRLRRQCSLQYDLHNMRPPKGRLFGASLWEPTVCCVSIAFMWLSIVSFVIAGSYVAVRGINIISNVMAQQLAIMQKNALQE
jgi:hypothetical protein